MVKRPAAAQRKPEAETKQKKKTKKPGAQADKKDKATRKKPSTRRQPKCLDVDGLLGDHPGLISDVESDDETGFLDVSSLLSNSEPDDDYNVGDDEDRDNDEDRGLDASPLIEMINEFLRRMPTNDRAHLVDNWTTFGCLSSPERPLPCGSGCTGSPMDQHVINGVTEVHRA